MGGGSSKKATTPGLSEDQQHKVFQNKHFKFSPVDDPTMCMTYGADGIKVAACADTTDHYWAMQSMNAIKKANQESNGAGSGEENQGGPVAFTSGLAPACYTTDNKTYYIDANGVPCNVQQGIAGDVGTQLCAGTEITTATLAQITGGDAQGTPKCILPPSNDQDPNADPNLDPNDGTVDPFSGYINRRGFGFDVKFIDILFFIIILWIISKLL